MADQYTPVPNPGAGPGEPDTRHTVGPYIDGGPAAMVTLPGYPPNVGTTDPTYPAGPSAAGISVPRAVMYSADGYVPHASMTADDPVHGPPITDTDGDDGLPNVPRYEGPPVSDANNALPAPLVNPSAGNQGPAERGMSDVNPLGAPVVSPGDVPPSRFAQVVPDTTVG
jgi:hypothetical protein